MCTYCNGPHAFGTQWCLGQCWVPITTHAVQDHIAYLPNPSARTDELWRVYGLTTKSLQGLVDDDPASSIHPIAFLMSGAIGTYRYYGDPKKKSVERLHLTPRLRRKLGRLHPTPRLRRKLGRGNRRTNRRTNRRANQPRLAHLECESSQLTEIQRGGLVVPT